MRRKSGIHLSGEVIAMHADGADYEAVRGVYYEAVGRYGSVDIVVNGSGRNRQEAVVSGLDDFIAKGPSVSAGMIAANCLSKQ